MPKKDSYHSSDRSARSELELPARLILDICQVAGPHDLIETARKNLTKEGTIRAVRRHDSPAIFSWLLKAVSYQGISDYVASHYMEKNGTASYEDIRRALAVAGICEKLVDFTNYVDCGFEKSKRICRNQQSFSCCPVPMLPLRNGRLNQTAISLFLFTRDIANGELVSWINNNSQFGPAHFAAKRLSAALGAVFGISHKVASLALSGLMLACSSFKPRWGEVGAQLIVVDSLTHNFLHRTGLLRHLAAEHLYGPGCYLDGGCSDVLRRISRCIDAKQFNPEYPSDFPRFVQKAIWRFCAELELDICNGRRIDDQLGCKQASCAVFELCAREPIKPS